MITRNHLAACLSALLPALALAQAASSSATANDGPNTWAGLGTVKNWQTSVAKANDGRETPFIWAAPEGKGPCPAIVWFHGAPADIGEQGEHAEADRGRFDLFLKAGFVVCIGDYRGEPAVPPAISGVDDAVAILRQVKSLPAVDPKRVVIIGHSLGGATTYIAATHEPVAAMVVSAGAAYALLGMPMGSLRGQSPGGELPPDRYNKALALEVLGKITAPTLIFYGEADPLSRANKTIYDLMRELKKNVTLRTFPDEHHGMLWRPNDRERGLRAWTTMVDFVSAALQTSATQPGS